MIHGIVTWLVSHWFSLVVLLAALMGLIAFCSRMFQVFKAPKPHGNPFEEWVEGKREQ